MALLSNLVFLSFFFASPSLASFRMRCAVFDGAYRIDPIDTPGTAAKHAHLIHGGLNFDMSTSFEDLRASSCSSCQVPEDKSAYWVPSLHFYHDDGTFEAVPQIGGLAVYYFFRSGFDNKPVTPFPPGFRMIAGNSKLRDFPWPVPDPETSFWNETDFDQRALRQKALGFNCLHYDNPPNEDTLFRHFLPEKEFLENTCYSGIRIEVAFPSCWNGKDVDSPDHKSHVAYPNFVQSGNCPEEYPIRLPTLLYEIIFDTQINKGKAGKYVFSNGDTTGFGNHGDFYSGWDPAFLQQAIEQCNDSFADISKCPVFKLQSDEDFIACAKQFKPPTMVAREQCAARGPSLCGGNVMDGMASPAAPAPALPPVVSPPSPAPPVVQPPSPAEAPAPTAAPIAPPPADVPHAYTLTSMIGGKKVFIFIDEVEVTEEVTTTIEGPEPSPPPLPPPPPPAPATPHEDPPPPNTVVPSPPAVTPVDPPTVYQDVTTTLLVKRHLHHARGPAHGRHRR
ncbi:hypothetical protein FKW77_000587 [Venturia effusa]|uniref:DUF1996 domain-containing protein n=1 Tax=Venturia effusa TaxID=50376 RepID=A0A517KYX9_9PEZI|nr:hypothetical protein FKW77_000587 [Venturia effusa]